MQSGIRVVLVVVLAAAAARAGAQVVPPAQGASSACCGDLMLGVLRAQPPVPLTRAQHTCLELPGEELEPQGPHGDKRLSTACLVTSFKTIGSAPQANWSLAEYQRTLVFTAETPQPGSNATDRVTQQEVVLFQILEPGRARPVWHMQFETGDYAVWRSITPEIALSPQGATLLSVMRCVNGTGGCSQDFLLRHADGRWFPVEQQWLDRLPAGYRDRIQHGVRIDPRTLRAAAGFYGPGDPNCCPSQSLVADLTIQGDSLVLRGPVRLEPAPK